MSRQQSPWTAADVPDQHGRTAVITGANTGIGFETGRILAERGATVVLACRNQEKANQAAARIAEAAPGANVTVVRLDLASLASVRDAAARLAAEHPRIDLLINNAGVMVPPLTRTEDGFELQFGINHLGHFAFTGLLLDRLLPVPGSRVVTVSSNGHKVGRIRFDDLQWRRGYRKIAAYGQSKLANLLFTYELQRRLAGARTVAVAAHPGTSTTELERYAPRRYRYMGTILPRQSAQMGALPTLRAATDPEVLGGDYYGPDGLAEFTGHPARVESSARSHDEAVAGRLWTVSEALTNVRYPLGDLRSDH